MTDDATRALIAEANEKFEYATEGGDFDDWEQLGRLVPKLVAALEAATAETEWEYGCINIDAHMGPLPLTQAIDYDADPAEHGADCPKPEIVRRRAASPWVPVEGDKPDDQAPN